MKEEKTYTISGTLTNYEGLPLKNGVVHLKGDKFKDLYSTTTDIKGQFSIVAPSNQYLALYAVKDYAENYLEFWHWNLNLNRNIERHIKIDTLELYNINAWKSYGGLMIYFRPMSLKKYKKTGSKGANDSKARGKSVLPTLSKDSIKVFVDGIPVEVRRADKVNEVTSSDGNIIEGILVNTSFPKSSSSTKLKEICLDVFDTETGEKGMGCYDMLNHVWHF